MKILVVDDEVASLQATGVCLRAIPDAVIVLEQDSAAAATLLENERFDVVLTDLRMPEKGGIDILHIVRRIDPDQIVIVMTGFPTIETAIDCIKAGAADYVVKPVHSTELLETIRRLTEQKQLRRENTVLTRQLQRSYAFSEIIGDSAAIQHVTGVMSKVTAADVDVLITGETGVGKELIAQSIHRGNWRSTGHFVPVDCGAIPESLIESELFGHERGAFTGADRPKMGLMELADRGTLFLDEIGELPISVQPKFLRALQERRFRRVGGVDEIAVNIRVVAATNRDLLALVQQQRFREDLYYRIRVARIDIPPLRQRIEDITMLVQHSVARFGADMGKTSVEVDPVLMELFTRYRWPGNVRELQNIIKWTLAMAPGTRLTIDHVPEEIALLATAGSRSEPVPGGFFAVREQHLGQFEKSYLESLLRSHAGDVSRAAEEALLPRGTLYRLLKKHGINPETFRR